MSFISNQVDVGHLDLKIIDIDPIDAAKSLQIFLERGSLRGSEINGVSIEDISTAVVEVPSNPTTVTLSDLISKGMKLFDALVWLTAGRPASRPLKVDPAPKKDEIPSRHEIGRSVFYVYFLLLTQARYPVGTQSTEKPRVPNFLRVIMGMEEDQSVYVDRLCSFELSKLDPSWAKVVNFSKFGQESLSRFGICVAGYRLFGPFKLYEPKEGIPESLKIAVESAQIVANSPPTWDIHPLNRPPAVLTKRGDLNKNLSNLVLDVSTDEQIDEMVKSKLLYTKPKRTPKSREYLQWSALDNISGSSMIFRFYSTFPCAKFSGSIRR